MNQAMEPTAPTGHGSRLGVLTADVVAPTTRGRRKIHCAVSLYYLYIIYAVLQISLTELAHLGCKDDPITLPSMEKKYFPEFSSGAIARTTHSGWTRNF